MDLAIVTSTMLSDIWISAESIEIWEIQSIYPAQSQSGLQQSGVAIIEEALHSLHSFEL